ncbi:MAG: calcium/sodium antiporter [Candidatus Cyclobacteriaceae bacterium M3_2C_046]
MNFLLLIGGIVAIILSANWLVDGATAVARKFGISDIVIGLTIVAFGTSAPELTVNIFSALNDATDIAIGNVLGSNIANIFLILGLSSIIYPLVIQKNTTWKEIPLSLLAAIVLGIVANDQLIDRSTEMNAITRIDGLIFLSFFVIFLVYTVEIVKNTPPEADDQTKVIPIGRGVLMILAGLVGLYFGGKFLVQGASTIAANLGISQRIIGLTIVAVGTSLPELATSIIAATKKKTDIAVGNVVGSNIFNIFLILGVTSLIKPLPFSPSMNLDIGVTILASLLLFFTTITIGRRKVDRIEGVIFLILYAAYLIYSINFSS